MRCSCRTRCAGRSSVVCGERLAAPMALVLVVAVVAGCQPRVQLEAPKDPIVINLNVRIEQEVRVRVERDLEGLLDDPVLFGG